MCRLTLNIWRFRPRWKQNSFGLKCAKTLGHVDQGTSLFSSRCAFQYRVSLGKRCLPINLLLLGQMVPSSQSRTKSSNRTQCASLQELELEDRDIVDVLQARSNYFFLPPLQFWLRQSKAPVSDGRRHAMRSQSFVLPSRRFKHLACLAVNLYP